MKIALRAFKTHFYRTYILPDSRVYILVETKDNLWEVWDGFRLSVAEDIQVSKIGVTAPDRLEMNISDRTNFQRVVLRASTVVSLVKYFIIYSVILSFFFIMN